jgi:hypothetical protein
MEVIRLRDSSRDPVLKKNSGRARGAQCSILEAIQGEWLLSQNVKLSRSWFSLCENSRT